jgi:hypothetical protein
VDDTDTARLGVGHVGVLAVGCQSDALRFVTHGDFGDAGIVIGSNYRDTVITRINGKNQFVIMREGNGAGIRWPVVNLRARFQANLRQARGQSQRCG